MSEQYIPIIFTIASLAVFVFIIFGLRKSFASQRAPDARRVSDITEPFLFRETGASGGSHRDRLTRLGGAQNVLLVIVTDAVFAVGAGGIFRHVPIDNDLEHVVEVDRLLLVEEAKVSGCVHVGFVRDEGKPAHLVLKLRQRKAFMDAIARVRPDLFPERVS